MRTSGLGWREAEKGRKTGWESGFHVTKLWQNRMGTCLHGVHVDLFWCEGRLNFLIIQTKMWKIEQSSHRHNVSVPSVV